MSGHSKWATIKRKKAATDSARGRIFTRCIREITIASRQGGGDPTGNPRLRTAILAAKAVNMPGDNIERAIKRGTGELEGVSYDEILYEGYGPFGVAVLAEAVTDNRNRTASEVRHVFTKHGGNLGAVGSVAWIFEPKGIVLVDRARVDEEALMEVALDAGAEDVTTEESVYRVVGSPVGLHTLQAALEAKGIPVQSALLDRLPTSTKSLGPAEAEKFLKFYEALEENDDIQKLFANFEISDEVLEQLG